MFVYFIIVKLYTDIFQIKFRLRTSDNFIHLRKKRRYQIECTRHVSMVILFRYAQR